MFLCIRDKDERNGGRTCTSSRIAHPFTFTYFCLIERPDKFRVIAKSFGCSVKLSWKPPARNGCPVTRYTIHYRESVVSNNDTMPWQIKNMNAEHSDQQVHHLWLECSRTYDIIVLGWNERGHSDFDEDSMVSVSTENGKYPLCSKKGCWVIDQKTA